MKNAFVHLEGVSNEWLHTHYVGLHLNRGLVHRIISK